MYLNLFFIFCLSTVYVWNMIGSFSVQLSGLSPFPLFDYRSVCVRERGSEYIPMDYN